MPGQGGQGEEEAAGSQDRGEWARPHRDPRCCGDRGRASRVCGLKAFGRIESTRRIDGKTETDVRFYALSRRLTPQELLATAPCDWLIENALHWQLDVSFREMVRAFARTTAQPTSPSCAALSTSRVSIRARDP
jgi:hypothetical protein